MEIRTNFMRFASAYGVTLRTTCFEEGSTLSRVASGERHVYKIGDRIRKVIIEVEEEYEADSER